MSVVSIEFDLIEWGKVEAAMKFISSTPELQYLIKQKGFKLRRRAASEFLTGEPRPVLRWQAEKWRHPILYVKRPQSSLCYVIGAGDLFTQDNLPPLMDTTIQEMKEREEKCKEREEKARKKKEAERKLKEEMKKKKEGKETQPETTVTVGRKKKRKSMEEVIKKKESEVPDLNKEYASVKDKEGDIPTSEE